jgi:hypothetical protein
MGALRVVVRDPVTFAVQHATMSDSMCRYVKPQTGLNRFFLKARKAIVRARFWPRLRVAVSIAFGRGRGGTLDPARLSSRLANGLKSL